MAMFNATVVNIALPHIGDDFGVRVGSLQWVLTGRERCLSGTRPSLLGCSFHGGRGLVGLAGLGHWVA
jgi:hypothetical protein